MSHSIHNRLHSRQVYPGTSAAHTQQVTQQTSLSRHISCTYTTGYTADKSIQAHQLHIHKLTMTNNTQKQLNLSIKF